MDLEERGKDLAYDVAFWSLGLSDASFPVRELGRLSMELVDKFRSLAIMALLAKGDCDAFYHHLIRGARARQIYLARLADESVDDDHHQASGRFDALLNAVAAADFDVARQIAELSPFEWRQGHEYEDDYCYAQLLHRFVQQPVPEDELPPLIDRPGRSIWRFVFLGTVYKKNNKWWIGFKHPSGARWVYRPTELPTKTAARVFVKRVEVDIENSGNGLGLLEPGDATPGIL